MKKIPLSRLLLYILLIPILFPIGCLFYSFHQISKLKQMDENLEFYKVNLLLKAPQIQQNQDKIKEFQHPRGDYLECYVETSSLLSKELNMLLNQCRQNQTLQSDSVIQRMKFLQSDENRLFFKQGTVESVKFIKETQMSTAHTVEIDGDDLCHLLSMIEGIPFKTDQTIPLNKPHLIITDFSLKKKKTNLQESFFLDLKFIKREYS